MRNKGARDMAHSQLCPLTTQGEILEFQKRKEGRCWMQDPLTVTGLLTIEFFRNLITST